MFNALCPISATKKKRKEKESERRNKGRKKRKKEVAEGGQETGVGGACTKDWEKMTYIYFICLTKKKIQYQHTNYLHKTQRTSHLLLALAISLGFCSALLPLSVSWLLLLPLLCNSLFASGEATDWYVQNSMCKERGSEHDNGRLGENRGALHWIFMQVGTGNQAPPQWLLSYLTWVLTELPQLQASILVCF